MFLIKKHHKLALTFLQKTKNLLKINLNHNNNQIQKSFNISQIINKNFITDMEPNNTTNKKPEESKKEETKFTFIKDETDTFKDNYGIIPLIQSQFDPELRNKNTWTELNQLSESSVGKKVKIRARLQRSRIKGAGGFVVLRQSFNTLQGVIFSGDNVSKQMVKFVGSLPLESIVDVEGIVSSAKQPIESCSQKNIELNISQIFLTVESTSILPFQMEDANRKGNPEEEEEELSAAAETQPQTPNGEAAQECAESAEAAKKDKKKGKKEKKDKEKLEKAAKQEKKEILVNIKTRLDNRVLDLRVPATQAMMKLQSGVGMLFREYLYKNDFVEIHTPKLISGTSEGGTNVFKLKYFDQEACLAQSPQLYKQMAVIGDIEKVFEIGPVFRAENSNTGRHLCEFTGLDIEMAFKDHYFEVLDVIGDLFYHIFQGIHTRFANELNIIANQYPFEPLKFSKNIVKLDFKEGVKMLEDANVHQDVNEDLSTDTEKCLGKLVREKYDTDFYILYGYPKSARPFYTMPDPKDDNFTNSYDAFIRGEEVLSGAQRIHVYDMLLNKVKDKGISPETIKDYLNAFKLGAPAHGGCGIGLERVVKLIAGIKNIKKCCMFPRDPKRLTP